MSPQPPAEVTTSAWGRSAPTGPFGPLNFGPATPPDQRTSDMLEVRIPLGRRVMVLSDLTLLPEPTPSSLALAADVAGVLERWEGPGVVVICGNLFVAPVTSPPTARQRILDALDAHAGLKEAMCHFGARPDCRIVVLPGWRDPAFREDPGCGPELVALGMEVVGGVDLLLETAGGLRRVLLRAGAPGDLPAGQVTTDTTDTRPWFNGLGRLEDPTASGRFVTSRLLYRRLGRIFLWVALLPALVASLLRLPVVFLALDRFLGGHSGPRRALAHAYAATWPDRLLFALGATTVVVGVMALVVAVASRVAWTALGGDALMPAWQRHSAPPRPLAEPDPSAVLLLDGGPAPDAVRSAISTGAAGVIIGGATRPELSRLDPGFYAVPGATAELVREHAGRCGLPPVFVHHRQASWIELETGADLHVRLLLGDADLPTSTALERLVSAERVVKGHKAAPDVHPAQVASWPHGATWPPASDTSGERTRVRRTRRIAAFAIFATGLVDLLEAVTPPLRSHLHLIEQFLPLGLSQAAGALVALAGVSLMMLARGVLRGQRRSWSVSVVLLSVTIGLHLAHDAALVGILLAAGVLTLLLVKRAHFAAVTDPGSLRSAMVVLGLGAATAVGAASLAIGLNGAFRRHPLPPWPEVLGAAAERLVGLHTVSLPDAVDDWISPSLLAVGMALAVVALALLTRPVVDRRLSAGRGGPRRRTAEARARDIVRRHGSGTLDYFALRDDKQWFFHRDSIVAYAVNGGVCLVSPDPIGPVSERVQVWEAMRRFADRHGWAVAVMAAAEEWLPIYRESGMRYVYIGDEAVVDVRTFGLDGGHMKGLRQAINRVRRNGYTVEILDPTKLGDARTCQLVELMSANRRGDQERGFSMTLGRVFDQRDTGLLLTVVNGPDGSPAAVCQFVPSPAIGGYSLDLMRRDQGQHPNGLLDFALVATIEHVRQHGGRGLSLNFAAMRSTLEGENGDGLTQRVERWALRRLSGVLQIESLWRFNAKYEPAWSPRYVVWDSAEQFMPALVQILRAESLTDIPVVGRFFASGGSRPGSTLEPASEN